MMWEIVSLVLQFLIASKAFIVDKNVLLGDFIPNAFLKNVWTVLPCLPDFHSWLLVECMGAMLFIYILFIFVGYVHCSTYSFS